jgi:hypothetical protein
MGEFVSRFPIFVVTDGRGGELDLGLLGSRVRARRLLRYAGGVPKAAAGSGSSSARCASPANSPGARRVSARGRAAGGAAAK